MDKRGSRTTEGKAAFEEVVALKRNKRSKRTRI